MIIIIEMTYNPIKIWQSISTGTSRKHADQVSMRTSSTSLTVKEMPISTKMKMAFLIHQICKIKKIGECINMCGI
jgi:hypothetical protein